jgi:hypothetical protein
LANPRGGRRDGESPALRLTRCFCRHGLEQPAAAMRHLLLIVRTRNPGMDFCIDLGLRERRVAVAPTVRGGGSSKVLRAQRRFDRCSTHRLHSRTPAVGVRPNRSTPREDFPGRGDPAYPRHPVGRLATTRSIGSRPNWSIHRRISRWQDPEILAFTHLEGVPMGEGTCISVTHQDVKSDTGDLAPAMPRSPPSSSHWDHDLGRNRRRRESPASVRSVADMRKPAAMRSTTAV